MSARPLSELLAGLIEGMTPHHTWLVVEEAELQIPLRLDIVPGQGGFRAVASLAPSPWHSGFEPQMQRAGFRVEASPREASNARIGARSGRESL